MTTAIGLPILDSSLFIPELRPKKKESALHEMATRALEIGAVRDPDLLHETLVMRERLATTGVGKGVAIPNARSIAVVEPRLFVARSRRGIAWGAHDGQLVHLVLLALSPSEVSEEAHHDLLARALGAVRLQRSRQKLLDAPGFDAVATILREVWA
jgi:mannitol/fructose-specific phosphotransferase system IIA component (Ntr-type)